MRLRQYRKSDALEVGHLIAATYRAYNLSHADPEEQDRLLGPSRHTFSDDPKYQPMKKMLTS